MSLVGSFVHEKAEGLDEYFTALGKLHVLYNVQLLYNIYHSTIQNVVHIITA